MAFVKIKARRVKGQVRSKPFVYGSAAFWMGKNSPEEQSHRWTVYLRGLQMEDLSTFIKKVEFQLHTSFERSLRTLEKPPYEVTEMGWGEFVIGIRVHFHDPREQPINLSHHLRLFPEGGGQQTTKKPVISEKYDEFVFVNPLESFAKQLDAKPPMFFVDHPLKPHLPTTWYGQQEQRQLVQLDEAARILKHKTEELQARLHDIDAEMEEMKSQLK